MGALPEKAVREFIDRHVGRESDAQVAVARERLLAGDADGAIDLLNAAREADPDNSRITVALAEAQAAGGDVTAAEETLGSLPAEVREQPEVAALESHLYFQAEAATAASVTDLEARLAADPGDLEAQYQLAMLKVVDGDYETALELLLELMKKDRSFKDDAGRRGLVKVFEMLGDDPLVSRYRSRMASLLF
jgi:putative thioredoxin